MNRNAQAYIELIMSQRDASEPFYMLLDPLHALKKDHPLSLQSIAQALGKNRLTTVPRPDLAYNTAICPHLVLLAQAHQTLEQAGAQTLFNASVAHALHEYPGATRSICGWLQSQLDPRALADLLAQRMIYDSRSKQVITYAQALTPEIRPHVRIYPIHQPLRLELMYGAAHQIDPDLFPRWLNPISQWIFSAANPTFYRVSAIPPAHDVTSLPPQAIAAQTDAIPVAHALGVWLRQASKPLSAAQRQQAPLLSRRGEPLPQQAAISCWHALKAGVAKGLRNRDDLIVFAMLRLLTHPRFDQHPLISQAVTTAAKGGPSLEAQLGQIGHAQWMHILQELHQS